MKISKYFEDSELVGPDILNSGLPAIWFIDPRLLTLLDAIREKFGPIVINNWKVGGTYKNSGYRSPNCTEGGKLSQHKFGRAADLKFDKVTNKEVYKEILNNESYWMSKGLRAMEHINSTPTWLHIDIRNTNLNKILIVNP